MLMGDAARADREQRTGDLQRILDASHNLHRLIQSLLDPATGLRASGTDLMEYRRTLRHDLRTPINAIKGYGEMLREDAADGGETRWSPISTGSWEKQPSSSIGSMAW